MTDARREPQVAWRGEHQRTPEVGEPTRAQGRAVVAGEQEVQRASIGDDVRRAAERERRPDPEPPDEGVVQPEDATPFNDPGTGQRRPPMMAVDLPFHDDVPVTEVDVLGGQGEDLGRDHPARDCELREVAERRAGQRRRQDDAPASPRAS